MKEQQNCHCNKQDLNANVWKRERFTTDIRETKLNVKCGKNLGVSLLLNFSHDHKKEIPQKKQQQQQQQQKTIKYSSFVWRTVQHWHN